MTQKERDRLVVLKKTQKKLTTQRQAAEELGVTERHVRRMLVKLKEAGDRSIVHGLRGRPSNRKRSPELRERAVRILSLEVYHGFGPTLASEYLARKHKLRIGCGAGANRRSSPSINGGRAKPRAARWCSGTPASTTG